MPLVGELRCEAGEEFGELLAVCRRQGCGRGTECCVDARLALLD
jgi:hypothetical protein